MAVPDYWADGFLGHDTLAVPARVREAHPQWYSLLIEVNRAAMALQFEAKVERDSALQVVVATSFCRTLASVQASVRLLEFGLVSQARAMLRTALEALFVLCAAAADPAFAKRLVLSQEAERRSLHDKLKQLAATTQDAELSETLTQLAFPSPETTMAQGVNVFETAKAASMLNWYFGLYPQLSLDAHATVISLDGHLERDQSGELAGILNEPQIDGQGPTWSYAVEILIRASEAFADVLGLEYGHRAPFRTKLKSLTKSLT